MKIAFKRSGRCKPRAGDMKVIDDLFTSCLNGMKGRNRSLQRVDWGENT